MVFHVANFNHGTLLRQQEKLVTYVAIGPEEFHRFATEEVENVNLADESCYMIQDGADEDFAEKVSFDRNAGRKQGPVN